MSYSIRYNQAKNQLEVETPYCIIDSASLVTPVPFKGKGDDSGKGIPRYSIRALFDLSFTGAQEFLKELRTECNQLVDNIEQFHPLFAPLNTPVNQIVTDCIKVGSEVIAEKKTQDAKAIKKAEQAKRAAPSEKAYNPAMDYLAGLFYFYARASIAYPARIFDRDNQILTPSSDEFFAPSFKGKLRLVIKRMPAFNSGDKEVGGSLVAYVNSVQFIRLTPEIDYRRALSGFSAVDSDDEAECMFNIPKKKVIEDDVPIFGAPKKAAVKVGPRTLPKDDITDYTEKF